MELRPCSNDEVERPPRSARSSAGRSRSPPTIVRRPNPASGVIDSAQVPPLNEDLSHEQGNRPANPSGKLQLFCRFCSLWTMNSEGMQDIHKNVGRIQRRRPQHNCGSSIHDAVECVDDVWRRTPSLWLRSMRTQVPAARPRTPNRQATPSRLDTKPLKDRGLPLQDRFARAIDVVAAVAVSGQATAASGRLAVQ